MSTINDGGPALACARCAEPSVIKQGRQWRRAPEVGMWLRIQERHDKGGAPLVRVERIDERGWVFVTDWLDFDTEAPRDPLPGGYVPPRERTFAFDADAFSRRSLRYWKRVTPNAEAHRGA